MTVHTSRIHGALLTLVLACTPLWAQEQRDPTLPPGATASAGAGADASSSPLGASGANVIVRDGKPYLVVGTRLVAVGQRVGSAKLERITETEIWLRDGGSLQKLPRFAGIRRSATVATACGTRQPGKVGKKAAPKPPASAASAATPCEGAQP